MGEEPAPDSDSVRLLVAEPADPAGVYANLVQIRPTDYDFALDFAQVTPQVSEDAAERVRAAGEIVFPTKVRVVLPVTVIPALINALSNSFSKYAKARGLQVPPGIPEPSE